MREEDAATSLTNYITIAKKTQDRVKTAIIIDKKDKRA